MGRLKTTGIGILAWAFVSLAILNFLLEMNLLQRIGITVRCVISREKRLLHSSALCQASSLQGKASGRSQFHHSC